MKLARGEKELQLPIRESAKSRNKVPSSMLLVYAS